VKRLRLLLKDERQQRREALEQQRATGEILKIIGRSTTDVQPVFETIIRNAMRLCDGASGAVFRYDGKLMEIGALDKNMAPHVERMFRAGLPVAAGDETPSAQCIAERRIINVSDILASEYSESVKERARAFGYRSVLSVPMMREGTPLGAIAVVHREPGEFSDSYVALLKTFADQAVIAIENVRLFNETKEALERQTATGEILKVIASSPSDVQPVFETICKSAAQLCDAKDAVLWRVDGDTMRVGGHFGDLPVEEVPVASSAPGRAVLDREVVHVRDLQAETVRFPRGSEVARRLGLRTTVNVPLMREGKAIGVISARRAEIQPFSDKQIGLLKTFADQAVIAIENVRLFKELQERTEALTKSVGQLTALGEVGQAISSTLDLEKVLKTIVQRAVQLAGLDGGSIYEFDERDEAFHLRAAEHVEEEIIEVSRKSPIRLGEGAVGRAGATREPVVVEDVLDESYQSRVRELLIKSGSRAVLAVPLLRENLLLGALVVSRKSAGPFAPEVIDLLKTFATQSAVAIQNARLFIETKESLDQQKSSAEVLAVISSSIADTKPVFDKILESCTRLFGGHDSGIALVGEDGLVHLAAHHGAHAEELRRVFPVPLSRESGTGTAIIERRVMHYPDTSRPDVPPFVRRSAETVGFKSVIFAPMFWEDTGIGAIYVGRRFAGAFTEKQIALLRSFADQAVIAIQNAKLFREIQEKSAQLEVANKHKSDFLANMSHELRTPLNAIIGFSEAMMDRMFGDLNEKQADYLKDIHESGKHLLSLINDILDLSKIEAGKMELELATFHLPTAVSNAVTLVRERAMRHGIALGLDLDQRLGDFLADERKVKQILLNLLSNAVKFTPDGGRVDVTAKLDTDNVEIAVKDTGVGISSEDQASLFEEFKQLGKDGSRKAEGTGLGLALTKRLVELHGGQISVDSAVGHGSTFRVLLPLHANG
jgi:signal transduction histidine kinase/putative methionine-R-sulfoxide reductase with GAF domain